MKQEKIIKGNKLFAEFDGWIVNKELSSSWYLSTGNFHLEKNGNNLASDTLRYHSSWDWLMPIWDKFRKLQGLPAQEFSLLYRSILNCIERNDIEGAFEFLTSGIEWYNQNK